LSPGIRRGNIEKGKRDLDHPNDPMLRRYGIQVERGMVELDARVLPGPTLEFGGSTYTASEGAWIKGGPGRDEDTNQKWTVNKVISSDARLMSECRHQEMGSSYLF